nr:unnamed protein product [Callosobruchus chinensis]
MEKSLQRSLSFEYTVIGERFALLDIKTAVAHVLSHFEIESSFETPQKIQFRPFSFGSLSKDPIYLNFKPLKE